MRFRVIVRKTVYLAAAALFLLAGCEDQVNSVVSRSDKNEFFELTLETSSDIVNTRSSLDIMAKVKRLKAGLADVSNKVLGVWDLIYDEPDTLDPTQLEISYTFKNDSTVTRVET